MITKKSKSEAFLQNRDKPPVVSAKMANSVSQYRKAMLEQEIDAGVYRESSVSSPYIIGSEHERTPAGYIKGSSKLNKIAQLGGTSSSSNGSGGYRGSGGTLRQVPEVYSPLWLTSNLNLPRDRATINAWCRSFFALNPIVQNAISLHSTYPISKLNIKCKDPKARKFFETMIEETQLLNICTQIAQEFWCLGEAFPYGILDESTGKWSKFLLQNPDFMVVRKSAVSDEPSISLRPDENLRRICIGNRPSDLKQRQQLDPKIVEYVKRGDNIPMSNLYISHISRKISPYEIRGTSLIVSCFKQLMLFDKLRESKFAQADNLINPITLVKVGGPDYKPTPADLEAVREAFEQAQYDKDFKLFSHEQLSIERIGASGGIYDISGDITQLIKEIYIGLMVPSAVMDGGADTTYANASVSLDVLKQRYMQFRHLLSDWLRRQVFAPISQINDFYEYVDGKKVLIVPEIEWNHMSIFDTGDYINTLQQLLTAQPPKVSLHTMYRSLGLEFDDEVRRLKHEMIQQAIQQKEMEALMHTSLADLRALDEDSEIKEVKESTLPGESPMEEGAAPLPGMEGGLGMPPPGGGGLQPPGGLPPAPPPPGTPTT